MTTIVNPDGPTLARTSVPNAKTSVPADAGHGVPGRAAASATQGGDRVQLTASARAIGGALARDAEAPVDAQRVKAIRQSIVDGTYTVDAQQVADKLLSLERQLG